MQTYFKNTKNINVTGGGAYKYNELLHVIFKSKKELDVEIIKINEFDSLIKGL